MHEKEIYDKKKGKKACLNKENGTHSKKKEITYQNKYDTEHHKIELNLRFMIITVESLSHLFGLVL